MSSGVRWAIGFSGFLVIVVMVTLAFRLARSRDGRCATSSTSSLRSDFVDVAGTSGGAGAGLDRDARGVALPRDCGGDRAVAQVADSAGLHGDDTPHADAHPAAAGHEDAGVL